MSMQRIKRTAARGGTKRRAAPAGGAHSWGRGCRFIQRVAVTSAAVALLVPHAAKSGSTPLEVPSGLGVYLLEFIEDRGGMQPKLRARFVAPALATEPADVDTVLSDMEHLCNSVAIPEAQSREAAPTRIIVSISSTPVELGEIAPDVAQYFEVFSIENGTCIWELF